MELTTGRKPLSGAAHVNQLRRPWLRQPDVANASVELGRLRCRHRPETDRFRGDMVLLHQSQQSFVSGSRQRAFAMMPI